MKSLSKLTWLIAGILLTATVVPVFAFTNAPVSKGSNALTPARNVNCSTKWTTGLEATISLPYTVGNSSAISLTSGSVAYLIDYAKNGCDFKVVFQMPTDHNTVENYVFKCENLVAYKGLNQRVVCESPSTIADDYLHPSPLLKKEKIVFSQQSNIFNVEWETITDKRASLPSIERSYDLSRSSFSGRGTISVLVKQ